MLGAASFVLAVVGFQVAAAAKYNFLPQSYEQRYPSPRSYPVHAFRQEDCRTGYRPNDKGGCIDIDECSRNPLVLCGVNADCFNTAGSYVCICRAGYEKNSRDECANVNECEEPKYDPYYPKKPPKKLNLCTVNEDCVDEIGSYSCYCKAGFVRDEHTGCREIGFRLKTQKYVHVNPYYYEPYPHYPRPDPYPYPPKDSYPPNPYPPKDSYPPNPYPQKDSYPPNPYPADNTHQSNPYPADNTHQSNPYPADNTQQSNPYPGTEAGAKDSSAQGIEYPAYDPNSNVQYPGTGSQAADPYRDTSGHPAQQQDSNQYVGGP